MQRPPSTSIATPVIIEASSLQRKQAALPRSSGVEKRPIGIVARNFARISGVSSPMKVLSIGVSPATGLRATTRMPKGASSTAIERVAVMTQPLLALYQARRGRGLTPAVLAMLRITPFFCALKRGAVDPLDVDRKDAVELVFGEILERLRQVAHAGVVDEDVEAAETLVHGLDHRLDVGTDGDVGTNAERRGAEPG